MMDLIVLKPVTCTAERQAGDQFLSAMQAKLSVILLHRDSISGEDDFHGSSGNPESEKINGSDQIDRTYLDFSV